MLASDPMAHRRQGWNSSQAVQPLATATPAEENSASKASIVRAPPITEGKSERASESPGSPGTG